MRRVRAAGYSEKFTALDTLGGDILDHLRNEGKPLDDVRESVLGIWQLVAKDLRWETHASFAVMLTRILLNMNATGVAEPLVLWFLKGEPRAPAAPLGSDAGSDAPGAAAVPFPGLLGMLNHGDPTAAGGSVVENLKLSLCMWSEKIFLKDTKAHGEPVD